MDVKAIRKIGFDVIEKSQEFLMPVPPVAVTGRNLLPLSGSISSH
jgi:hypothetical protein